MFNKISTALHMTAVVDVKKIIDADVRKQADVAKLKEALDGIRLSELSDPAHLEEIAAGLCTVRGKLSYSSLHKRARKLIDDSVNAVQARKGELRGNAHAGSVRRPASPLSHVGGADLA